MAWREIAEGKQYLVTNMQNEGNRGGLSKTATRIKTGKADDDDDDDPMKHRPDQGSISLSQSQYSVTRARLCQHEHYTLPNRKSLLIGHLLWPIATW